MRARAATAKPAFTYLLVGALAAATFAACGSGDNLDTDSPPTSRAGKFPAVAVSTTVPVTNAFGRPTKPSTATTVKKSSKPSTATTMAPTPTSQLPAGRVKPAEAGLPTARTGVGGTMWRGQVVVVGGSTASGRTSARVDVFDPQSGVWSSGPTLPVALHDAAVSTLGDDLWVVGGFAAEGDQDVAVATSYYFHPGDADWRTGPTLQTARGGAAIATVGAFLFVIGGQTTDGGVLDTVEVLPAGGSAWRDNVPPLTRKRAYASALAMNGRVYVVGGRAEGVSTALDSVESWHAGATTWRNESHLAEPRASAAGAGSCVAGGENGSGTVATVECFGDGFWTTAFQMRAPRYGASAALLDGYLHVTGGTQGDSVSATHEVFDLGA
jgi:hypothetical protein